MSDQKKLKILIADDEPHIRLMLKTIITSMGAEIAGEAKNGAEAIEFYKKNLPNITLLDINMPVKTGVDALKEIKAEFPNALILMMTSVADMKTVEKCIELGAANYMLKDTPIPEIKNMIKETWAEYKEQLKGE
ncbi:MAG: response regulator [Desulfobacterales bacterium]|nr:response regulator [Desulfobacterales bacterium]